MFKGKTPDKLMIPPPCLDPDGVLSAYTSKKRKTAFLTQAKKLTNEQLVTQSHTQLINYIDTLQDRVQKIIQSHDSQFLLAYRNHINRVRQEMQQLKNKNAKQANSSSNQTQKIQTLQKQLIIFRQESLKLFDRMTQKDKQLQLYKMKVYQLQTQQKFNKKSIAELMKRNKYLQGMIKQFNLNKTLQNNQNEQTTEKKKSCSFLEVNSLRKYSSQQKRTSRKIGLTDHSFFYKKNQLSQNQIEKDSRPTTTALGTKRNSISMYSQQNANSLNQYFAKNLAPNFRKS